MEVTVKRAYLVVVVAACLACGPASAQDKAKKKAKPKVEAGTSCKAPAVGTCAACSITCRPGETAICSSGQISGDVCHLQPSCRCTR